jgi:hypothetical protein
MSGHPVGVRVVFHHRLPGELAVRPLDDYLVALPAGGWPTDPDGHDV